MALYRTLGDEAFKNFGKSAIEIVSPLEWADEIDKSRIDEQSWIERYEYEAALIAETIEDNKYKKILELGSGPGMLAQCILKLLPDLDYSFIDKDTSKAIFEKRKFKGNEFYVKDLMHSFDISNLDNDYDLIIANDFLEHIANPSHVMYQTRNITKENASFFISVPNWRMNHEFIYRGLFDYDNFLYFCEIHGWKPESVAGSPLQCQYRARETSEQTMPDELIQSWNWYFITKKVNN
jgi:2-polyprenyl-3-methyl-5-hydroxy-6-metoxy-1,4-benzoquinol methylase